MKATVIMNSSTYSVFYVEGMRLPVFSMTDKNGFKRNVSNEVTRRKVMAALVDAAHTEALEMDEAIEWAKLTPAQKDLHTARVILGVALKSKHDVDDAVTACHIEALEQDEKRTVMIATNNDRAFGVYWRFTDETSCVSAYREWNSKRDEALKMNALIDHAEIAETDLARRALCFRLNYTAEGQVRRIKEAHAEALRMNEGIDLALRILTCMKGDYKVGGAVAGCLIRDGYHEVDYLIQVAARKYAQQGTAEIITHGI